MARRREKTLTYRDQTGASLTAHADHWRGFRFMAGPVQLTLLGKHGNIQVYAASRAEGERVILHACSVAGIDPASDPTAEWLEADHSGTWLGHVYEVETMVSRGALQVSKRDGAAGLPDRIVEDF